MSKKRDHNEMDTYIGTTVVSVRAFEVRRRIARELDPSNFNFTDPDCIEGAALLKDHIATKYKVDAGCIARDVAATLWHMHSRGLTHGSVDVCNIAVDFNTGRAQLLPGCTMQFRRWAAAGDMPLGTGKHTTTTAAMHFTGARRWDTALEDLWALAVVVMQLLDFGSELNSKMSAIPRLVWLAELFAQPARRKELLEPLLAAQLPHDFKALLETWWLGCDKVASASPCDFYRSLGFNNLPSCEAAVAIFLIDAPDDARSEVLEFAVHSLRLPMLDAEFVRKTQAEFDARFNNRRMNKVASVMLAIKLCLHLHLKLAEKACAALAQQFLEQEHAQAIGALETWFLTRVKEVADTTPPSTSKSAI